MDAADALLATVMFGDLARADVEELKPHLREHSYARGQSLWTEGASAVALYVLAAGQLKSHRISQDGTELILGMVGAGEVIGEVGLFHPGGVRLVSVTAMTPTVCFTIPRDPLLAFMPRHPKMMLRMLQSLSGLAARAAYTLSDLAFEDIRGRVARALLDLAAEQGEPVASGLRIRLKLSQATLGAMVSATRENVNRALSEFLVRGEVSQSDGFFIVHDKKALEEAVARAL